MAFFEAFDNDDWHVVVEDDDRAIYAYLVHDEEIVSDVWICNRLPTPTGPIRWDVEEDLPPLNPGEYVRPTMPSALDPSTLAVRWEGPDRATIHSADDLIARLTPENKPGWSAWAAKDGPCAQALG